MTYMKKHFIGVAIAALLVIGPVLPSDAEDAPAPAATSTDAPPPSVPRPSLAPKTTEPASPAAEAEPSHHRRYAYRHHRYGYYRTAYWEPFPIFWPHVYHSRIHWNRIPWIFHF
jgi:hypothetical protein